MTATDTYIDWLFQTNAGRHSMSHYVALVADAAGRYATVYVTGRSWDSVIDQLEAVGCEVIENQTNDYEESDFLNIEAMKEAGLWTIPDLLKKTTFVPHH